jgi:hypothetical protein
MAQELHTFSMPDLSDLSDEMDAPRQYDKYGMPELSDEVKARFHDNAGWFLLAFRIILACLIFVRFHKLGRAFNARQVAKAASAAGGGSDAAGGAAKGEAAQGEEKAAGKGDGAAAGGGSAQRRKARAKAA